MQIVYTILIGLLGGFIGIKSRFPAGGLIGAMLAVSAFKIMGVDVRFPSWTKYFAQITIGILVGLKIQKGFFGELKELILPALIIVCGMILWGVFLGAVIHKITGLDIVTSLFSSSPGGLTDMTIIAQSLGADSPKVVFLQLCRLVSVIFFYPIIIRILSRIMH